MQCLGSGSAWSATFWLHGSGCIFFIIILNDVGKKWKMGHWRLVCYFVLKLFTQKIFYFTIKIILFSPCSEINLKLKIKNFNNIWGKYLIFFIMDFRFFNIHPSFIYPDPQNCADPRIRIQGPKYQSNPARRKFALKT